MGFRRAIVPPGSQRLPPGEASAMAVTEAADITQAIAAALGGGPPADRARRYTDGDDRPSPGSGCLT